MKLKHATKILPERFSDELPVSLNRQSRGRKRFLTSFSYSCNDSKAKICSIYRERSNARARRCNSKVGDDRGASSDAKWRCYRQR